MAGLKDATTGCDLSSGFIPFLFSRVLVEKADLVVFIVASFFNILPYYSISYF
jgi:hypothetical protein